MSPKRGNSASFVLEPEQVGKVLRVCTMLSERIIVGVPLFLGLRVGELTHMRADWITREGYLAIPEEQSCGCTKCVASTKHPGIWTPKTTSGIRTLPISKPIQKDLLRFLQIQPNGLGFGRIRVWELTKDILRRAGVTQKGWSGGTVGPHVLRATCMTMLSNGGMSAAQLAYFDGWKSIAVASHYIDLVQAKDGALRQARKIFG